MVLILPCLICVAFFTLLERKILGIIGFRFGAYKVSMAGILQPLGDAFKLINKELNSLSNFSYLFYYFSSSFLIMGSFVLLFLLSFDFYLLSLKSSFIIIFIILGFNSFCSILAGWSVFSKFSLLGSLRSVCQLVSYEVLLYLCFFFTFSLFFSYSIDCFSFSNFSFFFFIIPFVFFFWVLSILAELNRTPYDFSEGESELVSGFNVEFGSSCFTLIFLSEYINIFFFMYLSSLVYLGVSNFYFFSIIFFFFVIWIRSVLPRYRFDKLMGLSWKVLVPQTTFIFCLFLSLIFLF